MSGFIIKEKYNIDDLLEIMKMLRSENGCPWDRQQTHESIKNNLIEETYEVIEAIDKNSAEMLREELGDLLLQVVFHSQMETEMNSFTFEDVADEVCKKLVERHPHIFGDIKVHSADDVLKNWDSIKKESKNQQTYSDTLDAVPKVFPALMRAQKISKRAARAGYDYKNATAAAGDLFSETEEFKKALESGNTKQCEEELGDVMFSCVNVAAKLGLDAEQTLTASTEKFIKRFKKAEKLAEEKGISLSECDSVMLDAIWKEVKTKE